MNAPLTQGWRNRGQGGPRTPDFGKSITVIISEASLEKSDEREKGRLNYDPFEFYAKTMKLKIKLKFFRLVDKAL